MRKIIISITIALFFSSSQLTDHIFTLNVKNENNIAIVSWDLTEAVEVINYSLYIEEGYVENFPKNIVANSIPVNAKQWKSSLRKSLKLFGFDFKHPSQWSDKGVITPGEIYTIGLEITYLDPATQTEAIDKDFTYLYPFTVIDKIDIDLAMMIQEIDPGQVEIKDSDIVFFLEKRSEKAYFNLDNKSILIGKIKEYPTTYYFYLDNNELIKAYKYPVRPRLYGNRNLVTNVLYFILFCALVLSIYFVHIMGRAVKYINYLALPENKPYDVMKTLIKKETAWIFIIYVIVLISKNYISNKFLNILVSETLSSNQKIFDEIYKILGIYRFYELTKIKSALFELFEHFGKTS